MQIKILHKQGESLRAIACELGCSVNTVRKYLNEEAPPAYQKRVCREPKVAPFAAYLQQRVDAAAPDWIPATVLWREIREKGFDGSERTVRNFVATLRSVRSPDPLVRFETAAGDQMQVDWIEFRRRKGASLFAFVATLGYCRASYVEFVADMRLDTLLECHANCFVWFGGVPRRALYDNMKTVVIERDAYGPKQHRFQSGFLDFAGHYGLPSASSRFTVTHDTLAVQLTLPLVRRVEDFHLQVSAPCRAHDEKKPRHAGVFQIHVLQLTWA